MLIYSINLSAQQTAIIVLDTVEVKSEKSFDSKTIGYLYSGDRIEYIQTIGEWIVMIDKGYIPKSSISLSINSLETLEKRQTSFIEDTTKIDTTGVKEYSESELLYLLLQEQKKNDQLRSDVKTIKSIQTYFAFLTTVFLVASIVTIGISGLQ